MPHMTTHMPFQAQNVTQACAACTQ
ncbi:hypothetical protein EMIT091MI3_120177 [Kosakonia quasisacchari]